MDSPTVEERKIEAFWNRFWEAYAAYPPGTRFRHDDGSRKIVAVVAAGA